MADMNSGLRGDTIWVSPRDVACSECGAEYGDRCRLASGATCSAHEARAVRASVCMWARQGARVLFPVGTTRRLRAALWKAIQ